MKKFLFFMFLIFISLHSHSNVESKIKIDLDFYNRHYWRGFQLGSAPAIEPNITFSNQGFNFSIWAARTINSSYSEIDLIPSYNWGNYTFTLFNYYNPIAGKENTYFIFSGKENLAKFKGRTSIFLR